MYLALAFVLYFIWLTWQREHVSPPPPQQADKQYGFVEESATAGAEDLPDVASSMGAEQQVDIKENQSAEKAAKSQQIHVRTDVLEVIIDSRGGDIRQVDLPTYPISLEEQSQPFRLLHSDSRIYIAQSGLQHKKSNNRRTENSLAPTHRDVYMVEKENHVLEEGQDSMEVKLIWFGDNDIKVEKIFTFYRDSFVFDVTHRVINQGTATWTGRQYQQLRHSPIPGNRSWLRLPTYTGTAFYDGAYHKHSFDDVDEEPITNEPVTGGWVAMLQHYFVSAWVPDTEEEKNFFYSKSVKAAGERQYLIGMFSPTKDIAPASSAEFTRRLYVGPKVQNRMREIATGLDLSVDYGMFTLLSKPLFWLLEWFYKLVGNWGVAIILVTVAVKLVFYKLSEASYKSMARMRKIQPRFKALRERYADDKQKLNQAIMQMYKKDKINPLGGCLPILVQMPVFLALYWVLVESVELRQAPFIFWINDLSIRDPIFVLPLLMGVSMYIQFKLNPAPPDPMQAKIFAMMPIMMTAFMAFFPAGLVLYWLMNNILSIAQQYVITRRIEKAAY